MRILVRETGRTQLSIIMVTERAIEHGEQFQFISTLAHLSFQVQQAAESFRIANRCRADHQHNVNKDPTGSVFSVYFRSFIRKVPAWRGSWVNVGMQAREVARQTTDGIVCLVCNVGSRKRISRTMRYRGYFYSFIYDCMRIPPNSGSGVI